MNHKYPKLNDLPLSKIEVIKVAPSIDKDHLKQVVSEFFDFYATQYKIGVHIISLFSGQWQKMSPEHQKSSGDASSVNWRNCVMFVQDIMSPGVNITAEISKEEVNSFSNLCKIFSANRLHKYFLAESMTTFKTQVKIQTESKSSVIGSTESVNSSTKKQLNFEQIYSRIEEENKALLIEESKQHIENRQIFVAHIRDLLVKCIQKAKINANVSVFGSSQYNLSRSRSDINLFVYTNSHKEVFSSLFECMSSPGMRNSFVNISKVYGHRVLKQQIGMTHTITGIKCFILVENDKSILDSCKIITKFIEHEPMCKSLIEYIRTWQNVLREMHPNNEIIKFHFNTYLISVLVIFFFQVNYGAPVIEHIWTNPTEMISEATNHPFMQYVQEFFSFYGNTYQIENHVISTHIGRLQQRKLQPVQGLSLAQQRLYDGMEKSPSSWKKCTMYVQDLVKTDLNFAAEIPRKAVENFQQMCQIFAEQMVDKKLIFNNK